LSACASHRDYLAAIADGETTLVPPATLDHVQSCPDCMREIRAHQVLGSRLRQAGEQLLQAAPTHPHIPVVSRRLGVIAACAAAAMLVAGAGAAWSVLSRPDPVLAAVNASSQPLEMQSSDPSQVGQWCMEASGKPVPALQLDEMRVVGARMDRIASTEIVSVAYVRPSGERITVSWFEGEAPPGSGVEQRDVSGHRLLIVHSAVGTAVVTGSSTNALWEAAAAIESSPA
jgi:hypothetical protein